MTLPATIDEEQAVQHVVDWLAWARSNKVDIFDVSIGFASEGGGRRFAKEQMKRFAAAHVDHRLVMMTAAMEGDGLAQDALLELWREMESRRAADEARRSDFDCAPAPQKPVIASRPISSAISPLSLLWTRSVNRPSTLSRHVGRRCEPREVLPAPAPSLQANLGLARTRSGSALSPISNCR